MPVFEPISYVPAGDLRRTLVLLPTVETGGLLSTVPGGTCESQLLSEYLSVRDNSWNSCLGPADLWLRLQVVLCPVQALQSLLPTDLSMYFSYHFLY